MDSSALPPPPPLPLPPQQQASGTHSHAENGWSYSGYGEGWREGTGLGAVNFPSSNAGLDEGGSGLHAGGGVAALHRRLGESEAAPLTAGNKGYGLLLKAGWSEGTGLGAQRQGAASFVAPAAQQSSRGLGFEKLKGKRGGRAR